jgi:hypothetical protein
VRTAFTVLYLDTINTLWSFSTPSPSEIFVAVKLDGDEDPESKGETLYRTLCGHDRFKEWLGTRERSGLLRACRKGTKDADFRPVDASGRPINRPVRDPKDSEIDAFDAAVQGCQLKAWFLITWRDTDDEEEPEEEAKPGEEDGDEDAGASEADEEG